MCVRQALQNGRTQILLWYSYFDLMKSDTPSAHWADLAWAANG